MELPFVVHPIFVHFPIAFYLLELILLFFWLVKKEEYYFNFALFAFRIGYSSMIIAMIAGFIDTDGFEHIQGRVRTHFISALTVFTLYTLRAFFCLPLLPPHFVDLKFKASNLKFSPFHLLSLNVFLFF